MWLSLQLMCLPNSLLTQLPLLLQGSKGRSASSVETADILVPSALHVMLHALTAGKRGTSKGFVMEGLLRCLQREHRLLRGIRLLRWSLLQWCPPSLTKSTTVVSINGFNAKALVDSGSSESFIHPKLAESASLLVYPTTSTISMATSSLETKVSGFCRVDLELEGGLIVTYTCQSFQNYVLT